MDEREPLLKVKNLTVQFPMREGTVNAVNGVDFVLRRGQTLGVVGESGSGKLVTARAIFAAISAPTATARASLTTMKSCELVTTPSRWMTMRFGLN